MVTALQMWLVRMRLLINGVEKLPYLTNRYQCVLFILIQFIRASIIVKCDELVST